jgi:hypothetical protein
MSPVSATSKSCHSTHVEELALAWPPTNQQGAGPVLRYIRIRGMLPRNSDHVINHSEVSLEDVVLSGSGFSENIRSVGPHAEARVLVRPQGESDVRVDFKARGRPVSFGPDGYFEAGGG